MDKDQPPIIRPLVLFFNGIAVGINLMKMYFPCCNLFPLNENKFVADAQLTGRSRLFTRLRSVAVCLFFISWSPAILALDIDIEPHLIPLMDELVAEGPYSHDELRQIFADVQIKESVLEAMQRPAEYKYTWGKYRSIFLGEERIALGVEFWKKHEAEILRAQSTYGVPAEIIVAIIGVESKYGRFLGSHRVLDSLATLVIGYPRRREFFSQELKHFLLLCKENQIAANTTMGSYAGAMGYPQFISSSYRNYAVDFSDDGRVDLITQPVDAIGSVANYLRENGWRAKGLITSGATTEVNASVHQLANRKRKTPYTAAELRQLGASIDTVIGPQEELNVLLLDASSRKLDVSSVHLVRAGDTACGIARKYKISCRQLIEANGLDKKATIHRGQKLRLPGKKSSSSATHRVQKGDTACAVARRYGMSCAQLIRDNNLGRNASIQIGQQLTVKSDAKSEIQQPQYFYTQHNFYVITRYNQSVLYAMAVVDLAAALRRAYGAQNGNSKWKISTEKH